jgi:preprotein translocase subunit SecE
MREIEKKWPRHKYKRLSARQTRPSLWALPLLVVGALAAFYLLSKQGHSRSGVPCWWAWRGCGVFFASEPGKELSAFGRDAWREVKKVVWPSRKEAIQMTLYVFGFVVVMALFLWLTDKTLEWVLYDLILGWRK